MEPCPYGKRIKTMLTAIQYDTIKSIFDSLNIDWVEPYVTTEGAINRKEVGNHTGLYFIYPEVNFLFRQSRN